MAGAPPRKPAGSGKSGPAAIDTGTLPLFPEMMMPLDKAPHVTAPEAGPLLAMPPSMIEAAPQADETLARFILELRSRGITDASLLNAFEAVPRAPFLPHIAAEHLYQPIHLPIPCGEEAQDAPSIARLLVLLDLKPGMVIAEIGSGTGFVSGLFARLGLQVLALERHRALVTSARKVLDGLGIAGVTMRQVDGLARGAIDQPVERIVMHGAMDHAPQHLFEALVPGGLAIGYRIRNRITGMSLWRKDMAGFLEETALGPSRLGPLMSGIPAKW